jgi:hypothetical protein
MLTDLFFFINALLKINKKLIIKISQMKLFYATPIAPSSQAG